MKSRCRVAPRTSRHAGSASGDLICTHTTPAVHSAAPTGVCMYALCGGQGTWVRTVLTRTNDATSGRRSEPRTKIDVRYGGGTHVFETDDTAAGAAGSRCTGPDAARAFRLLQFDVSGARGAGARPRGRGARERERGLTDTEHVPHTPLCAFAAEISY